MTETSFTIDELEELYALFKVSFKVNSCPFKGMKELSLIVLGLLDLSIRWFRGSTGPQHAQGGRQSRETKLPYLVGKVNQ